MLKEIRYKVFDINGDYAILIDEKGEENKVAMALLPDDIDVGNCILWKDFEYTIDRKSVV